MTTYVVDASVAMKWFVPEEFTDAALRFLKADHELLAPDLLWSEFGNILWKKVRSAELDSDEARQVMSLCHQVPFEVVDSKSLVDSALEIAMGLDRTVYDSVYLALAAYRSCAMLTADLRLCNSLQHSPMSRHIAHVSSA